MLGTSEPRLYTAVLIQALRDLLEPPPSKANRNKHGTWRANRDRALAWFDGSGHWFQEVCLAAGFEPDRVRRAAMLLFDHPDAGRKTLSAALGGSRARRRPDDARSARPAYMGVARLADPILQEVGSDVDQTIALWRKMGLGPDQVRALLGIPGREDWAGVRPHLMRRASELAQVPTRGAA